MSKTWLCYLIIPSLFWIFLSVTIKSAKVDRCPDGKYGVALSSGVLICKNCSTLSKCPHGMGMSLLVQCGDIIDEHTNLHCVFCIPGKNFSSNFDSAMCRPCQSMSCHPNEAFDGECTHSEDTTRCTGICKRGYFSRSGQVEDCEACSLCKGPKARRIQKCIDDEEPRKKQCEVLPLTIIATEQDGVVADTNEQHKTVKNSDKYNIFGHPGLFSSLLVIIAILGVCLLVKWQKRHRKQMETIQSPADTVPMNFVETGETVTEGTVQFVNENENDSTADLLASKSVQRKSFSSPVKRKVSFHFETSNPASETNDQEGESLIGRSDASHSDKKSDDFDEEAIAISSVRRRSSSSIQSNGKKGSHSSIIRQSSNPGSERRDEDKDSRKRSKSLSSFSNIISGQKGTAEETMPILPQDDNRNDIHPVSINMNTAIQVRCQDILTEKPSKLNASVYRNVCTKLNQEIESKDWNALAGHMGYSNEFVKNLKRNVDPAEALLSDWETKSGHDVKKLIGLLKKIERNDIIELMQQGNP